NRLVHVRDITTVHLTELVAQWEKAGFSINSRRNFLTNVKNFLRFCIRMKFLRENPATGLAKPPKRKQASKVRCKEDENATMPLDEEGRHEVYDRIMEGIHAYLTGARRKRSKDGKVFRRNPKNFRALLELMYETGLRISDAIHFEPDTMIVDEQG